MEGVCPRVAACQGLVVREDHRVILGIGLMAALANPAAVVRERVMEAPVTDGGPVTALGGLLGKGWPRTQGKTGSLSPPPESSPWLICQEGLLAVHSPTVGPGWGSPPDLGELSLLTCHRLHTHTHTRCPPQPSHGHSSWSHPMVCPSGPLGPAMASPARL